MKYTLLPPTVVRLALRESIVKFERNLSLTEYFHDSDISKYDPKVSKFRRKSTWTPPANSDKYLDFYNSVITDEIINAPEQKAYDN